MENKKMNKGIFMQKTVFTIALLLLVCVPLFSQEDTRYDAGLNLPFNEKAVEEPEGFDMLQDEQEPEPNGDELKQGKASPLKSVRSFFSGKLKKK